MIVHINSAGQNDRISVEPGDTIGTIFGDSEFREDYNIAERAVPQVNGEQVGMDYVLQEGDTIKPITPASSKSED
tara:strand:- start:14300 stop:14524 length:225 start_codon:yes stop_codon:yes gene_type:complete